MYFYTYMNDLWSRTRIKLSFESRWVDTLWSSRIQLCHHNSILEESLEMRLLRMDSRHGNLDLRNTFLPQWMMWSNACRRKWISSLKRLLQPFPMDTVLRFMLLKSWMERMHNTINCWLVWSDEFSSWVGLILKWRYQWCPLIWNCLWKIIWRMYIISLFTSRIITTLKWFLIQVKSNLIEAYFGNNTGPIQPTDMMILRRTWYKTCRIKLSTAWPWGSMLIVITQGNRWHIILGLILSYFLKIHQYIGCLRIRCTVKLIPLAVIFWLRNKW